MLKKVGQIITAVFVTAALSQVAHAGFDLGGMLDAGKDLTSAATLTDGQVKQLASEDSKAYDQSNKVAPSSSPYAKRLAKLTKGMKIDADQYALKFMKSNKYDPKTAVSALRKLEKMYGNYSNVFSIHPAPGDRAEALEKAI